MSTPKHLIVHTQGNCPLLSSPLKRHCVRLNPSRHYNYTYNTLRIEYSLLLLLLSLFLYLTYRYLIYYVSINELLSSLYLDIPHQCMPPSESCQQGFSCSITLRYNLCNQKSKHQSYKYYYKLKCVEVLVFIDIIIQ